MVLKWKVSSRSDLGCGPWGMEEVATGKTGGNLKSLFECLAFTEILWVPPWCYQKITVCYTEGQPNQLNVSNSKKLEAKQEGCMGSPTIWTLAIWTNSGTPESTSRIFDSANVYHPAHIIAYVSQSLTRSQAQLGWTIQHLHRVCILWNARLGLWIPLNRSESRQIPLKNGEVSEFKCCTSPGRDWCIPGSCERRADHFARTVALGWLVRHVHISSYGGMSE